MEVNEKEICKIPVEGGLLFSYRFCVVEAQRKKEIGIGWNFPTGSLEEAGFRMHLTSVLCTQGPG